MFAASVADGAELMAVMRSAAAGPHDTWRRVPPALAPEAAPPASGFRFGVPSRSQLDWACPGG